MPYGPGSEVGCRRMPAERVGCEASFEVATWLTPYGCVDFPARYARNPALTRRGRGPPFPSLAPLGRGNGGAKFAACSLAVLPLTPRPLSPEGRGQEWATSALVPGCPGLPSTSPLLPPPH